MIPRRLRLVNGKQRGFTLLELAIGIAIIGIIVAPVTMSILQVIRGTGLSNNRMTAVNNLRNAGDWLSREALMTKKLLWKDQDSGNLLLTPLTLTWVDYGVGGETHKVVYSIAGGELSRSLYIIFVLQVKSALAHFITSASWQFTNNESIDSVLTLTLTAIVGAGSEQVIETRTYEVHLRAGD